MSAGLVVFGLLWSFVAPVAALAAAYGSGGYSNCAYSTGCAASSSGGGSSSGGSSTTTNTGGAILLNDFNPYFTDDGKELLVSKNQIIYFDVTAGGQIIRHKVTITSIGPDYVDIVIASNPIHDRLYIGDSKQYDVNGDGQYDIQVTLNSISTSGKADMTFKSLSPPTTTPASTVAMPQKHNYWLLITSISAIFLGLLIWIIILLTRRHKRDNRQY